jgi:hypothetical protein
VVSLKLRPKQWKVSCCKSGGYLTDFDGPIASIFQDTKIISPIHSEDRVKCSYAKKVVFYQTTRCRTKFIFNRHYDRRSRWPGDLRRGSATVRFWGLRARIPPGAWMFIGIECCVVQFRGLCHRPDPSSRGVLPSVFVRITVIRFRQ